MKNNKRMPYQAPKARLIHFEAKDIITSSGIFGGEAVYFPRGSAAPSGTVTVTWSDLKSEE